MGVHSLKPQNLQMTEKHNSRSFPVTSDAAEDTVLNDAAKIHAACISHAESLVRVANRALDDEKLPNVAYHLATLALEEIGKAGFVAAKHATDGRRESAWIDKRLDDHEAKLFWALWTPGFGRNAVSREEIENARGLARQIHANRLQGIYVSTQPGTDGLQMPGDLITEDQARNLLGLTSTRIEMEKTIDLSTAGALDEDMKWFLDATADEGKSKLIFGQKSLDKLAELGGNTRNWARWLREQFVEADAQAQAAIAKELARTEPTGEAAVAAKWRVRIRVVSLSHSVRPKALAYWNTLTDWIKLSPGNDKRNEIIVEITLRASVQAQNLWFAAWAQARVFVTALNIGSFGFFWWETPRQPDRFYERIVDLEAPGDMELQVKRSPPLSVDWGRRALSKDDLARTGRLLALISSVGFERGNTIFGPYILGITFFSKTDVHFEFTKDACANFARCVFNSMKYFGAWNGERETRDAAFHGIFAEVVKEEAERNELLQLLELFDEPSAAGVKALTMDDAAKLKAVCDTYFWKVCRLQDQTPEQVEH